MMIFFMRDETKPYIVSLDIEHDGQNIIQIGAIMLKSIGESIYQICRSLNVYVKNNKGISTFVQKYTDISNSFLDVYGVELHDAIKQWNDFTNGIHKDDILIFSHGIFQDLTLMESNGFDVNDYEIWDTLNMSKFTFKRDSRLTLQELVCEVGFPPIKQHNAYSDAFSNLMLYSYLLKVQGDK